MKITAPATALAAMLLTAASVQAGTVHFDLSGTVSHYGNIDNTAEVMDSISVSGSFDSASVTHARDNIFSIKDIFDLQITGSILETMSGAYVHNAILVDNDTRSRSDLFRLMIRFDNGPSVNQHSDYAFSQLSFYVPVALDTFDSTPLSDPSEATEAQMVTDANGRDGQFVSIWRKSASDRTDQAHVNGAVTQISFAPETFSNSGAPVGPVVPLPATSLLLVAGLGGLIVLRRVL